MMKRKLYGIFAFGTLATAVSANATPHPRHQVAAVSSGANLWHGVRVGMTEEQVKRVLPGLEKNERNDDFHAPATQVAGQLFDVGVEMVSGRVARVSLTSEHALPTEAKAALEAKFGQAIRPYDCQADAFYHCRAEWRAPGGVTVSLVYLMVPGNSTTAISYEAPDTSGL